MIKEFNLIIAGVGGQGSILSSHIVGDAAIKDGYHARVAETYGAAIRGGAVMGQIRLGKEVSGPLIPLGRTDALLALEPMEGLRRGAVYLNPSSLAVLNTRPLYPIDVNLGRARYPSMDEISRSLRKLCKRIITLDGTGLAQEAGSQRTLNIVMIGALSSFGMFPLSEKSLREAIKERVPPGTEEMNMKAFELGVAAMRSESSIEAMDKTVRR